MYDLEEGFEGNLELSLSKAMEDVSQHSFTQEKALREKQRTFSSLQATLSYIENKCDTAEQELGSKVREILMLEGEVVHLNRQATALYDRSESINREITELQIQICTEEENAHLALARFNTYRNKMECHREAVFSAARCTEVQEEYDRKKERIRSMREKRDQLREDLRDPNGNAVLMAKKETDALRREVSERRTTAAEMREHLKREQETHENLKKEIEIQNRRHEAIVKRLRCQLSRAQAIHRHMSEEIYHLQSHLNELKRQQPSSQDSEVI
ncbi:coiled-coil domain-containing protein 122 [Oryzias latipes]|uniref:coiled-coil domain-containing protein 122 n=1 Tax=Oryzias latipes TaxID=8090 RepID=UPI0005CC3BFB|nr:coiled-coil domain-containing protein 122 [Oryzias latipes]